MSISQQEEPITPSDPAAIAAARSKTRKIRRCFEEGLSLLLEIHQGKEYKFLGYKSFEHYCQSEFDITARHGYDLIKAAFVNRNLSEILLKNRAKSAKNSSYFFRFLKVSSAIEIADLEPSQQAEIYERAKAIADAKRYVGKAAKYHKPGQVTAAIICRVRQELYPKKTETISLSYTEKTSTTSVPPATPLRPKTPNLILDAQTVRWDAFYQRLIIHCEIDGQTVLVQASDEQIDSSGMFAESEENADTEIEVECEREEIPSLYETFAVEDERQAA